MSAFRFDGIVINAIGEALPGVEVYVCTQPNSIDPNEPTIPPSPLAALFTDATGGTSATNPVTVSGNGNFYFYAASAFYTLVYHDPSGRIPDQVYPDQAVLSSGSGTVTSVALTMPAEFSVAGSPIVGAGTLAVTKANQNANLVWAGPATGSAAAPSFRALVTADLPGSLGSVSSVAASLSTGTLLSGSVTGSPITSSGTLAFTVGIANQAAHSFLAGPASGSSSGPTTSRVLVPADLPTPPITVAFSATPTFDASASLVQMMTLTGNVTASSVSNAYAGETLTFILTQDGTGSHTFVWPTNFRGASNIGSDANSVSVQSFVYTGSLWRANGPGSVNAT